MQDIVNILESNQVLSAVASGGVIVWLFANLKNILSTTKDFVVSVISFVVYNNYVDERGFGHDMYDRQVAFDRIVGRSKPIWERTTNLDLSMGSAGDSDDTSECSTISPLGINKLESNSSNNPAIKAYGFSIRILLGRLVVVTRTINKNQKITVDTSIRVLFSRKKKFLRRLNEEIGHEVEAMRAARIGGNMVKVHYGSRMWYAFTKKFKRGLDSIFLDNNGHLELMEDIRKFLENRETYQKMNYPYKYSALIHGAPGSGKTSTILAIASELRRDVEYVNLATSSAIDLLDRMNGHPERIFVFEDIDAIGFTANSRRGENEKEISKSANAECDYESWTNGEKDLTGTLSLSDLLNITDGLLSSDGTICIFTTNHKDRLDPAFLRAGRMNKTIEFTYMSPKTSSRMVKHHLGVDVDGFRDNIRPAEMQEAILDVKAGKKTVEELKADFS